MKRIIALFLLVMSLGVVGAQDDEITGDVITADNVANLTEIAHIPLSFVDGTPGTRSVAFSPDGTLVALGTRNGTVKLVDLEAGEEIATLEGLNRDVNDVAFHPGGDVLFAASSGGLMIHDLVAEEDATQILDFTPISIAPNPAGDQVAILLEFTANLFVAPFDLETRTLGVDDLTLTAPMDEGAVKLAYSADGSRIATVGLNMSSANHIINVFDAETGEIILTIDPEDSPGGGVALNEDGSIVYATAGLGNNPYVGAWDVETGEEIFFYPDVNGFGATLANGILFVSDGAANLILYNAEDGTEIFTYDIAYTSGDSMFVQVYDVAVSPDGTRIALAQAQENELVILGVSDE
ncbi:MAG: PQQ-binding-like beta-propeller repeat protein [Aggregatilineales bacterium]